MAYLFKNLNSLMDIFNLQNNNENCVADCTKALALEPRYKKALNRRSKALSELGNFKLALEDITACVMLDDFKDQADIAFADTLIRSLGKITIQDICIYHQKNKLNYLRIIN